MEGGGYYKYAQPGEAHDAENSRSDDRLNRTDLHITATNYHCRCVGVRLQRVPVKRLSAFSLGVAEQSAIVTYIKKFRL